MNPAETAPGRPLWQTLVWGAIVLYLIVALVVFWFYGFANLPPFL